MTTRNSRRWCWSVLVAVATPALAAAQAPAARPAVSLPGPGGAAGTVVAGKATVRYTHAYAVLVPASNTLILGCLDRALTAQEVDRVAAFARNETTGVFKYGLNTTSPAIFETTMPFTPGATSAATSALEGFDLTFSNIPIDWTYRFATDPALLKMNASFSGNTARLVDLGGDLKAGGRVRGRLTGAGRDPRESPPTRLTWDVAFDAVIVIAR